MPFSNERRYSGEQMLGMKFLEINTSALLADFQLLPSKKIQQLNKQ